MKKTKKMKQAMTTRAFVHWSFYRLQKNLLWAPLELLKAPMQFF